MEHLPSSIEAVVVGAGGAGLATLKNFLEQGFSTIALDERPGIGGIWTYTEDPIKISVLRNTVSNSSKQASCYTDWPFPKDVPDYPSALEIQEYLKSYVEHFGLRPHIKCGVRVVRIIRSEDRTRWNVYYKLNGEVEEKLLQADKVAIAVGRWVEPLIPKLEGIDQFKGFVKHSRAYKSASEFKGKRVLIVGFSNSGGDISTELVGVASKIYLSHKYGGYIVGRKDKKGRPLDHIRTRRGATLAAYIEKLMPNAIDSLVSTRLAVYFLQRISGKGKAYPASWGLNPKVPISRGRGAIVVNDELFDNLTDGNVTLVSAVSRIHPPDPSSSSSGNTIEFIDGTVLEDIDAIIYATGYTHIVYSSLLPHNDPTVLDADLAEQWCEASHNDGTPLYNLFWNIFDLSHPTSLAHVGQVSAGASAFTMFDVQSIAVAQVFSGNYVLPPSDDLRRFTREQNKYTIFKRSKAPIIPGLVPLKDLLDFLDEAAGTGLKEHVSYWGKGAWTSWIWTFSNWRLAKIIMGGLDTPFLWRLFDGRRKKWEGAEKAILEVNGRVV